MKQIDIVVLGWFNAGSHHKPIGKSRAACGNGKETNQRGRDCGSSGSSELHSRDGRKFRTISMPVDSTLQ